MELHQRSLIKIALISFLITFTLIYLIDTNFDLKPTNINSITISDINKHIKINGQIKKTATKNNNVFFEIKNQNTTLKGVLFNSNITLEKHKNYSIEGKITTYKKELEIIVYELSSEANS